MKIAIESDISEDLLRLPPSQEIDPRNAIAPSPLPKTSPGTSWVGAGLLCLSLLWPSSPALAADSGSSPPPNVTLSQAVFSALNARPELRAEQDKVQSAQETIGQAKSNYYPQLSASLQTMYANSLFGFFLFPGYQFENLNLLTVTLSQTLLDFGKTSSQVDQSRWGYRAAKAHMETVREQTIRDAESAYLTLLADQHQVLADRKNLEDADLQLDEATVRHQEGTSVILDVTRARVNVSAARLALVKSQDQVRSDSVTLAQIMGLSKTVFLVAADLDRDPNAIAHPDPDRDMSKALSHRPEWKEATADLESAKATLKNSKAQNYPSITALGQSFTATLPSGALPFTYIPNNYPYSTFSIGGTLTVPIFEGGYMVHQTARARADVMTARDNREATRLSIATDLKKAALSITDAKEQLDWALTSLDNARKNEMLVQEAYRMGQVQSVDVMDAQTALRQARESVIRARYLLMNSNVLYRYAVGTLASPEAAEHEASAARSTDSGQIR